MTARHLRRLRSDRSGAGVLEFAMMAMTLFAVMIGIIEFGRLAWARESLRATVLAGARCLGVLGPSCSSGGAASTTATTSFVTTMASGWGLTLATNAVTVNANATCQGLAGFSQVTITYTFQTLFPVLISALANGEVLTMTACFPNQK